MRRLLLSALAIVALAAGVAWSQNGVTGRYYAPPLAPVDTSGSASDLGSGTLNAARLPASVKPSISTVAFSATPTFDLSLGTSFTMTLTGNVTSSTFTNPTAGVTYAFTVCQDGSGLHSFAWPAAVKSTGLISIPGTALASTCAIQSLYYDGTNFRPTALGLLNQ